MVRRRAGADCFPINPESPLLLSELFSGTGCHIVMSEPYCGLPLFPQYALAYLFSRDDGLGVTVPERALSRGTLVHILYRVDGRVVSVLAQCHGPALCSASMVLR